MGRYRSTPHDIDGMPPGIPYIIGNEAAERFSYYGMRTILVVFMTKYFHYMVEGDVGTTMSNAQASAYYHNFVTATYFFPVLGSLLSDIFVGKYRTILWLSIVYCLGHLVLALMGSAGVAPGTWLIAGLALIAFGSGGIKPCVSAHVGDQFGRRNSRLMTRVFQWFYFSINFGSTISTVLTPVLLKWYGPHIAFGVPGVLMAIATLLFWMGRNKFVHIPPGRKRFFKETFSGEGVAALLKLSVIYAFVAMFWAVFDQTGSSWVIQAGNMDRWFLGIEWLESQIQVVNPILVMILIPLFQFAVYPCVNRVWRLTAVRKMSVGFFLAAASFALLQVAQQRIDEGQVPSIAWQLWAYVLLTTAELLISITGLEFSYTQAPKSMKSVIMAVWLFSVSLGNMLTSLVNHAIQVPGIGQVIEKAHTLKSGESQNVRSWQLQTTTDPVTSEGDPPVRNVRVLGPDNTLDTEDDVTMRFDSKNQLTSMETADNARLEAAYEVIREAFFESAPDATDGRLPSDVEGNALIAGSGDADAASPSLVYDQITIDAFRITSPGADGQLQTQWDVILRGTVSRAKPLTDDAAKEPYSWLEKRIIAAKGDEGRAEVERERGNIPTTVVSFDITVGGQDTLEGAAYFEFWTWLLVGTAVLFVPVAYFYKEKTYIQDEDSNEPGRHSTPTT